MPQRLLKSTWLLLLVRLAKKKLPPSFGINSFAEKLRCGHADKPTSWSDREVRTDSYRSSDMRHPLQTLLSHPGKYTSYLPPRPVWLASYTTWVILHHNSGTYNNADILLTWNIEYKAPSLVVSITCWSRVWLKVKHKNWILWYTASPTDVFILPW